MPDEEKIVPPNILGIEQLDDREHIGGVLDALAILLYFTILCMDDEVQKQLKELARDSRETIRKGFGEGSKERLAGRDKVYKFFEEALQGK